MDRSPPAFFNQGPSAHARLAFFAALAVVLLVVDSRLGALAALRQGVGTMLYPLQRALLVPRDALSLGREYLTGVDRLRAENAEMHRLEIANSRALLQAEQVGAENQRLRELLGARERAAIPSVIAEVLYDTRDPYTRRLVLDKGLQHGLLAGRRLVCPRHGRRRHHALSEGPIGCVPYVTVRLISGSLSPGQSAIPDPDENPVSLRRPPPV